MATATATLTATKIEAETETIQSNPSRVCRRPCYRREDERDVIAKQRRDSRKFDAYLFQDEYFYCKCQDIKTCIWSEGSHHSWSDDSCGISWSGVHGNDSICLVTRTGELDVSRVHGFLIFADVDEVFRNFRRAVVSEFEDLADPWSDLHRKLGKRIKKPFGVVSVAPLPDKVHKTSCAYEDTKFIKSIVEGLINEEASIPDENEIESDFDESDEDARIKYEVKLARRSWRALADNCPPCDQQNTVRFIKEKMEKEEIERGAAITIDECVKEPSYKYDAKMAIEFLKKKMKKPGDDFTLEETVKTAISAFQRLCNTNFNADEIQVSVMDPDYFVTESEDWFKEDLHVKHLKTVEIEKYLSDMKDQAKEWMLSDNHPDK